MRKGEVSRGGSGRRDGLAKQHLTWLRLQTVNFLKVMVCVSVYINACALVSVCICLSVTVLVCVCVSTRCICRNISGKGNQQAAVLSGAPALGDEADRIKTHHNTAVIFP